MNKSVQTPLRRSMLPCTLAELGWTMLLGCITFSVLTLAIWSTYFLVAFFWSIF
jgi:hypothetical protein